MAAAAHLIHGVACLRLFVYVEGAALGECFLGQLAAVAVHVEALAGAVAA